MDEQTRTIILAIALLAIVGAIGLLEYQKAPRATPATAQITPALQSNCTVGNCGAITQVISEKAAKYPRAVELVSPDGYLNLPQGKASISIGELVGKKVVLVDFWTYSCINCQRTIPYLNAWYEKYAGKGLEIIGVHTPEFDFEKDHANVAKAIEKFGIKYPVVQDNQYQTWSAYKNQYWPHKYLIDVDGFIVYDHIGEGGYEETEKKIQALLAERMDRLGAKQEISNQTAHPSAEAADGGKLGSPETYFGSARNRFLTNGQPGVAGVQNLSQPIRTELNELDLVGSWNFEQEYASNLQAGAKIVYRYDAKNVYFVAQANNQTQITVLRDGKPVQQEKGADVQSGAGGSHALVKEARLYHLIAEKGYGEHTLEIIVEGAGLKAYTFTFG